MATLNRYYVDFNKAIKLNEDKKESLLKSISSIQSKIEKYFEEKKSSELQPTFSGQGSFYMDTTINPILVDDENNEKKLEKYDLDYGVYFSKDSTEDKKKSIDTWHSWIYNAVDDHTSTPTNTKSTCVRVNFADGHHIDLPIYYKTNDSTQLGHKSKGWIDSKPTDFTDWFEEHASHRNKQELRTIVRFLKAWKNFIETENNNIKFPSGFALTILAVENFVQNDNYDVCLLETVKKIQKTLKSRFECKRPTTPIGENIFEELSSTRQDDFMNALASFVIDLENAKDETNYKKATEFLINHFGGKFPLGKDEDEKNNNTKLGALLGSATIPPKPYA